MLTLKVQLTAGICAAKALVQHLCERFYDPENVHIFIPGFSIHSRRKFCVQEVLMHMCLLSFHLNALFGLMGKVFAYAPADCAPEKLRGWLYLGMN